MNSIILKNIVRILVFVINLLAFSIMLKGHNHPGGGFIAGLITSLSLILVIITFDIKTVRRVLKVDPVFFAIAGLCLAYSTATSPLVIATAKNESGFFMKHSHELLSQTLGFDLGLSTPLFFDFGVYLVVVGVTSKVIMTFYYLVYDFKTDLLSETLVYSSQTDQPLEQNRQTGAQS